MRECQSYLYLGVNSKAAKVAQLSWFVDKRDSEDALSYDGLSYISSMSGERAVYRFALYDKLYLVEQRKACGIYTNDNKTRLELMGLSPNIPYLIY